MGFEINVVSNTPLTPLKDVDDVALIFLTNVGYIPKGYDPKTDAKTIKQSVPYRLFMECFLGRVERGWTAEQLATKLKTTKPTVYRHINKLKELDLLDEVEVKDGSTMRKGYRIRYGDLTKAWNFVESNVEIAMENYRKTVEHLQELARGDKHA
ncbi:MAG TPA: helix-turn-helix domain-containing protein [Thermoplasmata archaeon]|nr:helix-turn-helix domain-containing protein [Thermoplasmata archaeon]